MNAWLDKVSWMLLKRAWNEKYHQFAEDVLYSQSLVCYI